MFEQLFLLGEGGIARLTLKNKNVTLEQYLALMHPESNEGFTGAVPADGVDIYMQFLGAYEHDGNGHVTLSMAKARVEHMTRIRAARDAQWADFDRRYLAAQRDGADMTALDAERQALKDAPESVATALAAAATPEDLAAVWPAVLGG